MSTSTINTSQGAYLVKMSDVGFLGLGTRLEVIEPEPAAIKGIKLLVTNSGFLGLGTRVELRHPNNDNLLGAHEFYHFKPSVVKGFSGIVLATSVFLGLRFAGKI